MIFIYLECIYLWKKADSVGVNRWKSIKFKIIGLFGKLIDTAIFQKLALSTFKGGFEFLFRVDTLESQWWSV